MTVTAQFDTGWMSRSFWADRVAFTRHLSKTGNQVGVKAEVNPDLRTGIHHWHATAYKGGDATYVGLKTISGQAPTAEDATTLVDEALEALIKEYDL